MNTLPIQLAIPEETEEIWLQLHVNQNLYSILQTKIKARWVLGSHDSDYEGFYLLGCNAV
jgi:hypothetical protein